MTPLQKTAVLCISNELLSFKNKNKAFATI